MTGQKTIETVETTSIQHVFFSLSNVIQQKKKMQLEESKATAFL